LATFSPLPVIRSATGAPSLARPGPPIGSCGASKRPGRCPTSNGWHSGWVGASQKKFPHQDLFFGFLGAPNGRDLAYRSGRVGCQNDPHDEPRLMGGFGDGWGPPGYFFPNQVWNSAYFGGQMGAWGRLGGVAPSHFWSPDFLWPFGRVKKGGQVGEILLYPLGTYLGHRIFRHQKVILYHEDDCWLYL